MSCVCSCVRSMPQISQKAAGAVRPKNAYPTPFETVLRTEVALLKAKL